MMEPNAVPEKGFISRREFMEWMGGMVAVLGGTGCTKQPRELILPYAKMPEQIVPGVPLFYATTLNTSGDSLGVLVESHMGRPTKIEGNPDHPASLGSTDAIAQAAVLELYDPDRLQVPKYRGVTATWDNFEQVMAARLAEEKKTRGQGLRLLTETVHSPTMEMQIQEWLKLYPAARWVSYEPVHRDDVWEGARLAFGKALAARYDFEKADVIVSFDSDFMAHGPGHVRYAKQFARRRNGERAKFSRFYAWEITPTVTGSLADHRRPIRADELEHVIGWMAKRLGVAGATAVDLPDSLRTSAEVAARDLLANKGTSLVVAGDFISAPAQALVHAMNSILQNIGKTVVFQERGVAPDAKPQIEGMRQLVDEMAQGAVSTLIILGGNPVFNAPADLDFVGELKRVSFVVHHTVSESETSAASAWVVPSTHFLEHWSDARAFDGTRSIVQPLIAPLYSGKSPHEMLAVLCGKSSETGHVAVQRYWKSVFKLDFDKKWRKLLHDGVLKDDQSPVVSVRSASVPSIKRATLAADAVSLAIRPDPTIWDGRHSNNGWLQELPKPITKVTWDNTFQVCPSFAAELKVSNGDVVEVQAGPFKAEGPIYIVPGQAKRTLVTHLGYGRRTSGRVGNQFGFDAFRLLTTRFGWHPHSVKVAKTGRKIPVATTQGHFRMEGRDLVRSYFVDEVSKIKKSHSHHADAAEKPPTGRPFTDENYAWGMAIDLSVCNGCSACVVACQSENNIAVVGKEEVLRGREMHWLRVDRYYEGPSDDPKAFSQPVPCMHCEMAPCETVCPVAATTHSPEGLNEMTYNRCVGTKYCSNNCPYKVRRFNFYHYSDVVTPSLQLGRNPDVTVRARGVMEKCTFCVQRINSARIDAKRENRLVKDGEIVPACAAACPTDAIVFGNIKDPNARVSKMKEKPTHYALLEELGTRPRTTYLAHVENPNKEWPNG